MAINPPLFVSFPTPPVRIAQGQPIRPHTPQYPVSLLWDFNIDNTVSDGSGGFELTDGQTAFVQWWLHALRVEQNKYRIYPSGYGIDIQGIMSATTREAAQSIFQRNVQGLPAYDTFNRTKSVQNFSFTWEGDAMRVFFEVVGNNGTIVRMSQVVTG
jgi:hypothetical protein